jgi:hypothetical protein
MSKKKSNMRRRMNGSVVQEILDRIDQLSEPDRLLLEERLAERVESEWKRAAEDARKRARERGIDQAAIDQTVADQRYGS